MDWVLDDFEHGLGYAEVDGMMESMHTRLGTMMERYVCTKGVRVYFKAILTGLGVRAYKGGAVGSSSPRTHTV